MAWPEKRRRRSDRSIYYRIRDRNAQGKLIIVKSDAGRHWTAAEAWAKRYDEAKKNGAASIAEKKILDALADLLNSQPYSPATREKYTRAAKTYMDFTGHTLLLEIAPDEINRWRTAMESGELKWTRNGKKFYPYAGTTAHIRIVDLKVLCSYSVARGWLSVNPYDQIEIIEPEATERFLTRSEAGRLLWAARVTRYQAAGGKMVDEKIRLAVIQIGLDFPDQGKRAAATQLKAQGIDIWPASVGRIWRRHGMSSPVDRRSLKAQPSKPILWAKNGRANSLLRRVLHFGLYTGLREAEVRNARKEKLAVLELVDPKTSAVYRQYVLEVKGKGRNKKRVIPLPPAVIRINGIDRMLGQIGPIFEGLTKGKLAQGRQRAVRRSGLGRVRFHDLRHSFARNYLLSGAGGTPQAKKMMGHSRLSSLERYARFAVEDIAGTIGRVRPK